jgi:hypothetical protein
MGEGKEGGRAGEGEGEDAGIKERGTEGREEKGADQN